MAPRNLPMDISAQTLMEELVYTEARLLGDPSGADLAPKISALLPAVEEMRQMAFNVQRGQAQIQAKVDSINDEADKLVVDFEAELEHLVRDRKAARYQRYFGTRQCWEIVKLGLESQLEAIAGWPASVATEPEEVLKAFAPRFEDVIARGRAALAERVRIEGVRKDFRTRHKEPLVARLNHARMDLYSDLVRRGVDKNLPKSWPDRVFRASSRRSPANDEPVESPE